MKDNLYYKQLFKRYLNNECTPEELEELLDYVRGDEANKMIVEAFQGAGNKIRSERETEKTAWAERIRKELRKMGKTKVVPFYRKRFFSAAAAVCLVVLCWAFFYFLSRPQKETVTEIVEIHHPILPGKEKATLTLADGSVIELSGENNGNIATQGNSRISNIDGELKYSLSATKEKATLYNVIHTPRGGQYTVVLADGSKVWLNSSSSLRFPATFNETERRVELTGEGYFEIAPSRLPSGKRIPFFVNVNNVWNPGLVEALGTHFNIMAYEDEESVNTTLLEGAVKVDMNNQTVVLKPGEQAHAVSDKAIAVSSSVDTDNVIAWKNGMFFFYSENIQSIMRQISRWYDIEVSYKGAVSRESFSGIVSRESNLEQVLKIMEAGGVKFTIEGRKIIVMQ